MSTIQVDVTLKPPRGGHLKARDIGGGVEWIMGEASDDTKLTKDSVIEISRLPGYILQTTVMGEVVSKIESELLCRAYTYLYLGDDPVDKEAKENYGTFLLSLF